MSSATPKPLGDVRAAKDKLAKSWSDRPWFRGVGISPAGGSNLFKLRLTVDPSARGRSDLPTEFDGIPIDLVFLGSYEPRS